MKTLIGKLGVTPHVRHLLLLVEIQILSWVNIVHSILHRQRPLALSLMIRVRHLWLVPQPSGYLFSS